MRFLRTTAIGGLLFLLPLIVVGALIGQLAPIILAIAKALGGVLPGFIKTPSGITLLVMLAMGVVLLLCFVAGLIARRSFVRSLSEAFEKKLVLLFPRYAILKDQMADSIGGDQTRPQMKPVLVQFDDMRRVGFETERDDTMQLVAIYLPSAPDPWNGIVAIVDADRISPLSLNFGDAVGVCEQLGRGSNALISNSKGEDRPQA